MVEDVRLALNGKRAGGILWARGRQRAHRYEELLAKIEEHVPAAV